MATFVCSAIVIAAISTLAGQLEIRSPLKEISWGVIAGFVLAFGISWISAYLTHLTHGGKFPVELFYAILLVTAPTSCGILGWVGYMKVHNSRTVARSK